MRKAEGLERVAKGADRKRMVVGYKVTADRNKA